MKIAASDQLITGRDFALPPESAGGEFRAPGNRTLDQGAAIRAIPGKAEEGASLVGWRPTTTPPGEAWAPRAPAVLLPGALSGNARVSARARWCPRAPVSRPPRLRS